MPLDSPDRDTSSGNGGCDHTRSRTSDVQHENQARSDGTNSATSAPEWLQAYAGHLSRDIEAEDDENLTGSPHSSTPDTRPFPPQQSNNLASITKSYPSDWRNGQPKIQMELGASEVLPVHMAGAILTSMSSGVPSFPLPTQNQQGHSPGLGYEAQCMAMDNEAGLPGLVGQLSPFADFAEFSSELPIFPELESVIGESEMWSDIFNNSMFT